MNKILLIFLNAVLLLAEINSPVIGIYTQDYNESTVQTYIAKSYIQYLEMAGAQVVPIFYKSSKQHLKLQLSQLNGVLFPGGGMDFDVRETYTSNADFIFNYAKEQNDLGKVFPIWATCLGHQLVSFLTSGYDHNVIKQVHGQEAVVNTLQYKSKNSYLFTNWTEQNFRSTSEEQGVLYYNHHWAVYESYFNSNAKLHSFWNLLATTTSSQNQTFVTLMQAKNYPFYGCQFHPEKNSFEWKLDAARSSLDSIQIPQRLAQAFVEKAKLNPNRYLDESDLHKSLIHNYPVTLYPGNSFLAVYVFTER